MTWRCLLARLLFAHTDAASCSMVRLRVVAVNNANSDADGVVMWRRHAAMLLMTSPNISNANCDDDAGNRQ